MTLNLAASSNDDSIALFLEEIKMHEEKTSESCEFESTISIIETKFVRMENRLDFCEHETTTI